MPDSLIIELLKTSGLAFAVYIMWQSQREDKARSIAREQEIANERVANEKRFTEEQRALAEQYRNDRDCLLEVVKQNTAALVRLETAFDSWSKK
jgi:hypothetical protein